MRSVLDTLASPASRPNATMREDSNKPDMGDRAGLAWRLGSARPRLWRVARAHGFAPDIADDVVQETLLEAWRHLDAIQTAAGFDAWLNAVCRNVCRRHARALGIAAQRLAPLAPALAEDDLEGTEPSDDSVPAATDYDVLRDLDRQDLHILLDQALDRLTPETRELVTLCYLEETPQREAALRLGLTIAALEARLHRARRQLRAILAGDLRTQAEAFGVAFGPDHQPGWRESRLWCCACGRHRLRGAFEPLAPGRINLHMICPGCGYQVNSGGTVPLEGLTSFRPAYKRTLAYAAPFIAQGVIRGWQHCPGCGARRAMRLVDASGYASHGYPWGGLSVVLECPTCAIRLDTLAALVMWPQPEAQRFQARHPRCVNEPEIHTEFQGQPALRMRLADITSAARLTCVMHRDTLAVLATIHE